MGVKVVHPGGFADAKRKNENATAALDAVRAGKSAAAKLDPERDTSAEVADRAKRTGWNKRTDAQHTNRQ
jgi:hypothetical protein